MENLNFKFHDFPGYVRTLCILTGSSSSCRSTHSIKADIPFTSSVTKRISVKAVWGKQRVS